MYEWKMLIDKPNLLILEKIHMGHPPPLLPISLVGDPSFIFPFTTFKFDEYKLISKSSFEV